MCDTLVWQADDAIWFAKNSDREPDELQLVEYHEGFKGEARQQATYISVDVPKQRLACVISRPKWMWGAEMGVNEYGVAIGNEAVFTKLISKKGEALLGMDLLRLALQQANHARQAVDIITDYLTRYGQGGPAGFHNKNFRYDNSFMISDAAESWKLETAGRHWVAKKVHGFDAISNDLSIETEFDLASSSLQNMMIDGLDKRQPFNFKYHFASRFMPWAGKALQRRQCNLTGLSQLDGNTVSEHSFFKLMRQHKGDKPSGNADVCMHARGFWRPSATTNSMIIKLQIGQMPQIWTSYGQPCQNEYQAVPFGDISAQVRA